MVSARTNRIAISGTKPATLAAQHPVRAVPRSEVLEVTLLLRETDTSTPNTQLPIPKSQLPTANSPLVARREDVLAVRRFAALHRLKVLRVHTRRRTMVLRGRAGDMGRAFGIRLFHFEGAGHAFRSHGETLTIPEELSGIICGVFGLDNRPISRRPRFAAGSTLLPPPPNPHTKPPSAFRKLYSFPARATGKDQCIGVLEFGGGFERSKLNAYLAKLGVNTPTVVVREIAPGRNRPVNQPGTLSPDVEVYMDLEILASVAPGATLVVYFAENNNRGWVEALHAAIFDTTHRPSVLSISWGQAEQFWDAQTIAAIDEAFQMAAVLGITICCSSGDRGVFEAGKTPYTVPFPASSPHVLACGGTRLDARASRTVETVWNQSRAVGLASGGGVSRVFDLPPFQSGRRVPPRVGSVKGSGRGIPDVAANASSLTGYLIWADDTSMSMGGTSAAAPLWAGLVACLNEALGRRVGYLTPLLYTGNAARHGALRDIGHGNNQLSGRQGYRARHGWDPCTGLGTPHGTKLLRWLKATKRTKV